MKSESHEPGKKLFVQDKIILRNEDNGLIFYNRGEHLFYFYEGLFIEDLVSAGVTADAEALFAFLAGKEDLLTKNVQSDSPINICWMVSGKCNLDCIYCFADNKMTDASLPTTCEMDTAKHLVSFRPVSVVLTGGEPTLNPNLKDILLFFKGKVGNVIDTNGTTPQLTKLIPAIQETHTTVRLTVDILDDDILNQVRPRISVPGNADASYAQTEILKKNIRALTEAGVPLVVHTVFTRYNIGKLEETAEELLRLGVRRWHFYPVNYSVKCSAIYDSIKVSRQEGRAYAETLMARYGAYMKITCPINDIGDRERAVLLVDGNGRFCVDTVRHGNLYLGKDSHFPEMEDVRSGLDLALHQQAYLCNFW